MSPLETAISLLQEEVDSYHQGTKYQPKDGTYAYFLLRANVLGLAYLKRLNSLSLGDDIPAAERHYKRALSHHKAADTLSPVAGTDSVSPPPPSELTLSTGDPS